MIYSRTCDGIVTISFKDVDITLNVGYTDGIDYISPEYKIEIEKIVNKEGKVNIFLLDTETLVVESENDRLEFNLEEFFINFLWCRDICDVLADDIKINETLLEYLNYDKNYEEV